MFVPNTYSRLATHRATLDRGIVICVDKQRQGMQVLRHPSDFPTEILKLGGLSQFTAGERFRIRRKKWFFIVSYASIYLNKALNLLDLSFSQMDRDCTLGSSHG
uniref:Surfeit locus protein 1 n=1 Tax=Schistocephalus solidus TaxID=70667 RepID=A0A0X3Q501_SCHSO